VARGRFDEVSAPVRDSLDAIRVEFVGVHETEFAEAEIVHDPDHPGDIHYVLGVIEHDHDIG
jgi:hypothetical protein